MNATHPEIDSSLVTFTSFDVVHVIIRGQRSDFPANFELRVVIRLPASWLSMESPKWTEGLTVAGLYYDGIVDGDKLDEVIELHKRDTVSTFGTRSSRRMSEPKKKQVVHDENKPPNEQVAVKKVKQSLYTICK